MRTEFRNQGLAATLLVGHLVTAGAAVAAPMQYTINFTTGIGIAPIAGSFLYDSGVVSGLTIQWNDATFTPQQLNLGTACGTLQDSTTPSVIASAVLQQTIGPCSRMSRWRAEFDTLPGGQLLFVLENQTGNDDYYVGMSSRSAPGANTIARGLGSGDFQVVPDVPEPGTAILLLCGGVLLALCRNNRAMSSKGPPR